MSEQKNPVVVFKNTLDRLNSEGEIALPSDVSYDAFKNAAVVAVTDNPKILQCDPKSVFRSIRRLAGAGLVPDGREAALVPFKSKVNGQFVDVCQAMPMVYGLIKTIRNSGEVSTIYAEVVYEGEKVEVEIVEGERVFRHISDDGEPINFMDRGGNVVGAFAVVKMVDGSWDFEPMSYQAIDKRRRASANQKIYRKGERPKISEEPLGIWADWPEEMAKKTVIRALAKRLPMSGARLKRIMESDGPLERVKDVTPTETPGMARLRELKGEATPKDKAPPDEAEGGADGVLEGEVMPGEPEVDPESDWFKEGVKAVEDFGPGAICPQSYEPGSVEQINWQAGFSAQVEKEMAE